MVRPSAEVAQCPPAPTSSATPCAQARGLQSTCPAPPPSLSLSETLSPGGVHRAASVCPAQRSAGVCGRLIHAEGLGLWLAQLTSHQDRGNGNRTVSKFGFGCLRSKALVGPQAAQSAVGRAGVGSGLERLYPAVRGQWRGDVQPCERPLGARGGVTVRLARRLEGLSESPAGLGGGSC